MIVAYVSFSIKSRLSTLIMLLILPPFFGSSVSSIWVLGLVSLEFDNVEGFAQNAKNDVTRYTCGIALAIFGLLAAHTRFRELFYPLLCYGGSGGGGNNRGGGEERGGKGGGKEMGATGPRESSYDNGGWQGWKWRSGTTTLTSGGGGGGGGGRDDRLDSRASEISDITLDEAIRTPRNSLFSMERGLINRGGPSDDYLHMDWTNTIFEHGGARLVYSDVVNYLVIITSLMFLTEEKTAWAAIWTAGNWITGGGGGLVWVLAKVFFDTDYNGSG